VTILTKGTVYVARSHSNMKVMSYGVDIVIAKVADAKQRRQ